MRPLDCLRLVLLFHSSIPGNVLEDKQIDTPGLAARASLGVP